MTTNHELSIGRQKTWSARLALGLTSLIAAACGSASVGTTASTAGSTTSSSSSISSNAPPSTPSTAAAPASTQLASALSTAYQAESGALATYRNVVTALGAIGPFPNNVSAEETHVSALNTILSRYTLSTPSAGVGQASPSTLTAACQLGVTTEQAIISMYVAELPKVSSYADVTNEFQNLLSAARENQLPAFEHCA